MSEAKVTLTVQTGALDPRVEDSVERVARYSLIGKPDFPHKHGGDRMWVPRDLMIRFQRHTVRQLGLLVERTDWRLTNVELHAWARLTSGKESNKIDIVIEFDDLPHDWRLRDFRVKEPNYRRQNSADFPYVLDMIEACRPAAGEQV